MKPYDEMVSGGGAIRPHWQSLMGAVSGLSAGTLSDRGERARRQFRDNGVTYNVYDDPRGSERPWRFDLLPLPMAAAEWESLEAGLAQRARLLQLILADLYGTQSLLAGHYPPALVQANPRFLRPCRVTAPWGKPPALHFYAADLTRRPDGSWAVVSDRVDAPSGIGYALENRNVLARAFPEAFKSCSVRSLRPFFDLWQTALHALAPRHRDNPRIVLLTPGPHSETYFEHVYLARQLGLTLAEGNDLTVRGGQVFLKTLSGLNPVDVILRRLDSEYADPLELRADSVLGVVGLVQAMRDGNVAVANGLGTGVLETPALSALLPGLASRLLGEELALPSLTTWWCGQRDALEDGLARLDGLLASPALSSRGDEEVDPALLSELERAELVRRIRAEPHRWVLRQKPLPSTIPALTGKALAPHPMMLRVFMVAHGDQFRAMPGGFVRIATDGALPSMSMSSGSVSKDVWVLSTSEGEPMQPPASAAVAVELRRSAGEVPSRAAENLYWLGRYAERLDNIGRLLRSALWRVEDTGIGPRERTELMALVRMLTERGVIDPMLSVSLADGPAMIKALTTASAGASVLGATLDSIRRMVPSVRDRLSRDLVNVLTLLTGQTREGLSAANGDVGAAIEALDRLIAAVAAFGGMVGDNMTRHGGWRFLDIGRKLERSRFTVAALRGAFALPPAAVEATLTLALELCDSSITYRNRYLAAFNPAAVLDLLLADPSNPRAVAFQLAAIADHLAALPLAEWRSSAQGELRLAHALLGAVWTLELDLVTPANGLRKRLDQVLAEAEQRHQTLSEAITRTFFSHVRVARALGYGKVEP